MSGLNPWVLLNNQSFVPCDTTSWRNAPDAIDPVFYAFDCFGSTGRACGHAH